MIDFNFNKIKGLSPTVFNGLVNLETIMLFKSKITELKIYSMI
jgi:hypothetical protein